MLTLSIARRDKSYRYVTQLDAKVAAGGQSPTVVVDDMNNWNSCFTFDTGEFAPPSLKPPTTTSC